MVKCRYKMTKCRDKRSIVRALNTFSKQYDFIICNQKELNLSKEPMELSYCNKEEFVKLGNINTDNKDEYFIEKDRIYDKNIVFNKSKSIDNLQNTKLICEAVDNLISINRELELKENIKKQITKRENRTTEKNYFFINNKELRNDFADDNNYKSLEQLEEVLLLHEQKNNGRAIKNKKLFAKKLFSQIRNRVMFDKVGIYTTKNEKAKIKNGQRIIKPKHMSLAEIMISDFEDVFDRLSKWSKNQRRDAIERKKIMREEESHNGIIIESESYWEDDEEGNGYFVEPMISYTTKFFDKDMMDDSNTTFFQPYDEEEYNDPESTQQTKDNNMPNAMYNREHHGFYNKDIWKDELAEFINTNMDFIEELEADISILKNNYYDIMVNLVKKTLSISNKIEKNYKRQIDIRFLLDNLYEFNELKEENFSIFSEEDYKLLKNIKIEMENYFKAIAKFHSTSYIYPQKYLEENGEFINYDTISRNYFFTLLKIKNLAKTELNATCLSELMKLNKNKINNFCYLFDIVSDDLLEAVKYFDPNDYPKWLEEYNKEDDKDEEFIDYTTISRDDFFDLLNIKNLAKTELNATCLSELIRLKGNILNNFHYLFNIGGKDLLGAVEYFNPDNNLELLKEYIKEKKEFISCTVDSRNDFFTLLKIKNLAKTELNATCLSELLRQEEDILNNFCYFFSIDEEDLLKAVKYFDPNDYPAWFKEYNEYNTSSMD